VGTADRHIQALHDALVAEHQDRIAEVQQWAEEAKARGDHDGYRRNMEQVERLRAMPYPGEMAAAA
jgi:hypothetical protein